MACLVAEGCAFLDNQEITPNPRKSIAALREIKYAESFPAILNK
jgi:hypothetical protein